MRDLLTLYKLLWEQIKDNQEVIFITDETEILRQNGIIKRTEEVILDNDYLGIWHSECKKEFVQRRIKELENKE